MEEEEDALCYRQRAEKSTGGEMTQMQWSPTMDLLAAAFADNSVVLNRLSWQRIWSIPPLESVVTALAWRPDGRVLAVGRQAGSVCLYSVEDGRTLHEFSAGAAVSSLQWIWQAEQSLPIAEFEYEDKSLVFLPPLPALDTSPTGFTESSGESECKHPSDPKQLKTSTKLMDVLVIGDEIGRAHLCVSGVFLAASTRTEADSQLGAGHMLLTCMSDDLKQISTTVLVQQSTTAKLHLSTLNTSIMALRTHELKHIALEFGYISSLLEYMNATLQSMHEAWEDVLLMMDTKLATYSSTLPVGRTVSDEFLVLLACGRARPELQTFLIDELTAKGVKKIGLSLEMSYSSIRKYAVSYLNSAIQCMQFHLGEVLGMARWYERFGMLGLAESAIQDCISHLGTFALKTQELLCAIDDSLQNIKAFFQWLYVVILKLSDEQIPNGMKESLTPEELKLVIEFLKKRLSKASEGDTQTFNLEVVGQYLADGDLKFTEERLPSLWDKMMKEAKLDHGNAPWLFHPNPQKSLVQLFHMLHRSIDTAFAIPVATVRESFSVESSLELASFQLEDDSLCKTVKRLQPLVGGFVHEDGHYLFFPSGSCIVVLKYGGSSSTLLCGKFCISEVSSLSEDGADSSGGECSILSLRHYSPEALSVLFQYPSSVPAGENPSHTVAQLPIEAVASLPLTTVMPNDIIHCTKSTEAIDLGPSLTQVLSLGPFKPGSLAVSGPRRLAAVLSSTGKKIRLFDVDAEKEEEEG